MGDAVDVSGEVAMTAEAVRGSVYEMLGHFVHDECGEDVIRSAVEAALQPLVTAVAGCPTEVAWHVGVQIVVEPSGSECQAGAGRRIETNLSSRSPCGEVVVELFQAMAEERQSC